MNEDTPNSTLKKATLPLFTIITAVVVLIVFLYFTYTLLHAFVLQPSLGSDAEVLDGARRWDRALVLLNPIISLAFAGAGALLGAQVQQVRVTELKAEAKVKEQKINDAKSALNSSDVGGSGGVLDPTGRIAAARKILER